MLSHIHSCLNSFLARSRTKVTKDSTPDLDVELETKKQDGTCPHSDDDEILDDESDDVSFESDVSKEEEEKFERYFRYFVHMNTDVTQYILEFSATSDLCSRVRKVNRGFSHVLSVKNAWFTQRLMPNRGVADCVQVVRLLMHTYIYGRELHEKTIKMNRKNRGISDPLFFECATRVWAFESMNGSSHCFPTMHEVCMAWCHGLEQLSSKLLQLLLQRLGMDEHNLSAKDRRKLRKMFLSYRKKLRQFGTKRVDPSMWDVFDEKDDGTFDWRWLDETNNDPNAVTTGEQELPICVIHFTRSERAAQRKSDPLVMMGILRNRDMSRRFCRMLVDMDQTTRMSDRDLKQCRACVNIFAYDVLMLGQKEDVPLIRFCVNQGFFSPLHAATDCITIWEQRTLRRQVSSFNSLCGFDMKVDSETCMRDHLLFAQSLLPFLLSQVGKTRALEPGPFDDALMRLDFVFGDEDDQLKKDLKELVLSCF